MLFGREVVGRDIFLIFVLLLKPGRRDIFLIFLGGMVERYFFIFTLLLKGHTICFLGGMVERDIF